MKTKQQLKEAFLNLLANIDEELKSKQLFIGQFDNLHAVEHVVPSFYIGLTKNITDRELDSVLDNFYIQDINSNEPENYLGLFYIPKPIMIYPEDYADNH